MSNHRPPVDDEDVNDWLSRHQAVGESELDRILDVEAGLREVLTQSRHDHAVRALASVLDIETGLADILPARETQAIGAPEPGRVSMPSDGTLPALSAAERLKLRNQKDVQASHLRLRHLLANSRLTTDLHEARNVAGMLGLALDEDLAAALRNADSSWRIFGNLFLGDMHINPYSSLTTSIHRANSQLTRFAEALVADDGLAAASRHAAQIRRTLNRAHARARSSEARAGLAGALARSEDITAVLTLALSGDPQREALGSILCREVCRNIGSALRQEAPSLDVAAVSSLLDDFTRADLRNCDLDDCNVLIGVYWSQQTKWPKTMDVEALKARSRETPPGSGVWVVRSGPTLARDFAQLA